MATDPSGIFTLPPSTWVETGDTVLPEQHNPAMLELEQGMTDRLMRDGRAPMTGNLRMGDNKIIGMADGTSPTDAAAVGQVEKKITDAFKAWLTSVNKLDLAANEMVYASGANTAAKTALTSYARSLLSSSDPAAARGVLNINKGTIDGLGINATSVGGIEPGQIARRDTANEFAGDIRVWHNVVVSQTAGNQNLHFWFRDAAGRAIGLIYRRATDGALVFRRYNVADGAFEDALLLPGGIFQAAAFQGDGSRLTGIPAIGVGQTLTDVTASRNKDVTYHNNTGRTIVCTVVQSRASGGSHAYIMVNGLNISNNHVNVNPSSTASASAIVPNGSSYRCGWAGDGNKTGVTVTELR